MNPRIKQAIPVSGYKLDLTFDNGERRLFDCSPHLQYECMTALKDIAYFNRILIRYGTVGWPNGEDLCPDELYECSKPWSIETAGIRQCTDHYLTKDEVYASR